MAALVNDLEDEIAHLRDLDLMGLRARWRSAFRRKAPDYLPCWRGADVMAGAFHQKRRGVPISMYLPLL